MKVGLTETTFLLPNQEGQIIHYAPWIKVGLLCNHMMGRAISCYFDTGSAINVFPFEYAQVFLGFSIDKIKKGMYLPITGAGGTEAHAWGHGCDLFFGDIVINDTVVFFVEKQSSPLLGQHGFIDRFKEININMVDKYLDFLF